MARRLPASMRTREELTSLIEGRSACRACTSSAPKRNRRYAAELVALAPDVILASASAAMAAVQQTSRTVPIGCIAARPSSRDKSAANVFSFRPCGLCSPAPMR
jgi:hypothetical protein